MQAAILFEPDGYLLNRAKLMGRQSAGNGFLRAAIAAASGGTLSAYTPSQQSFDLFAQTVTGFDPTVRPQWIPAVRLDLLAEAGVLYRPDSAIDVSAALRLRQGLAAYSLCGVTHTMSSESALRHLFDLLTTPIMPWDALVCTSHAALTLVQDALAQNADYLSWRIGQPVRPPELQLPIIPLGVHAEDFATSDTVRAAARQRLGIAEDEIVALYAGRLSFSGKAHPVSMLRGLQAAYERTGRKIVLIQAGSFFNDSIARLYRDAAAKFSPDVRPLFVEGGESPAYSASWHAADLFVSLADSIQETFGLTPLEAMAAGLPVVVSDWNGYKDTVRDGIDGFRIHSWAPPAAADDMIARDHETRTGNFDTYLVRAGSAISINQRQLNDRLSDLVDDANLRANMGAAGRARVRSDYDWSILYPRYLALWDELAAIRHAHARQPEWIARIAGAPDHHPIAPDPYALFAHYPTALINADTTVESAPSVSLAEFETMTRDPLFAFANPPASLVAELLNLLTGPCTIGEIVAASERDLVNVTEAVARLAKMGLVVLR